MSLDSKRIWIIGASAGIGKALATHMAQEGAELVLSARSADAIESLATELPGQHLALPVDISDRESLSRHSDNLGELDMIVVLAAVYDPSSVMDIDPAKARQLVDINLLGSLHVSQLAPSLLKPGGKLVLCGSVAGYIGLPNGQLYSATKAAVINLAESLRNEWAGKFVVQLVSPGFVETRLTEKNTFDMPAIMDVDDAAAALLRGLKRNSFEIHFPKRFTYTVKFLASLPYALSLRLLARLKQEDRTA